jgi:peptidoglycan/xylan/chitin deacetylase (PgdA/CDA1 family)
LKPLIPRRIQISLRRKYIQHQAKKFADVWPIDDKAGNSPEGWPGWPQGKKFALVLTHDVDHECGHARCLDLADLEERMGFRSSFNFVPLRYDVSPEVRSRLKKRGFEIGVHGLYHDGRYYRSRRVFAERAIVINRYLKEWECAGYRAPAMDHKLAWFHDLNIEYDASTFDTDPFEPNADGVGTIFPFMVANIADRRSYVELPYTLPQDFTLFVLMQLDTIDIWKTKLDWIARHGGLALMNTHPDYMNFKGKHCNNEEYPARYYEEFLAYVQANYAGQYWHVLPRELARFWRKSFKNPSSR